MSVFYPHSKISKHTEKLSVIPCVSKTHSESFHVSFEKTYRKPELGMLVVHDSHENLHGAHPIFTWRRSIFPFLSRCCSKICWRTHFARLFRGCALGGAGYTSTQAGKSHIKKEKKTKPSTPLSDRILTETPDSRRYTHLAQPQS